uniref:Uncharacterized protein n=1 Tax=Heliothis virescens TaxID=7102 RepID=A0A2A4J8C9_HELVI
MLSCWLAGATKFAGRWSARPAEQPRSPAAAPAPPPRPPPTCSVNRVALGPRRQVRLTQTEAIRQTTQRSATPWRPSIGRRCAADTPTNDPRTTVQQGDVVTCGSSGPAGLDALAAAKRPPIVVLTAIQNRATRPQHRSFGRARSPVFTSCYFLRPPAHHFLIPDFISYLISHLCEALTFVNKVM